MKLIIADDHPIFREGLLKSIAQDSTFEIIAQTGDGLAALQLIEELKPDIAVLDISMPNLDGLEVVQRIKQGNIPTEFVILTMYKEEEYFDRAMDLGVKGYILKENAISDLLACLKAVARGHFYVSPLISDYLVNRSARMKRLIEEKPSVNELTNMERRILKLIAENKTSKEIADELHISYRTVQNHRTNICTKLGLKGYNKLLQFALEHRSLL